MQIRKPEYTVEQQDFLDSYNDKVQFYSLLGAGALVAALAVMTCASRAGNEYLTKRYNSLRPPPRRVRRAGTRSVDCLCWAALAVWRKSTYRKGQLVSLLGFQTWAQMGIIAALAGLNLALVFCGALGHPDYQAHHAARISFSLVPLLVATASRELGVLSWVVSRLRPAALRRRTTRE